MGKLELLEDTQCIRDTFNGGLEIRSVEFTPSFYGGGRTDMLQRWAQFER